MCLASGWSCSARWVISRRDVTLGTDMQTIEIHWSQKPTANSHTAMKTKMKTEKMPFGSASAESWKRKPVYEALPLIRSDDSVPGTHFQVIHSADLFSWNSRSSLICFHSSFLGEMESYTRFVEILGIRANLAKLILSARLRGRVTFSLVCAQNGIFDSEQNRNRNTEHRGADSAIIALFLRYRVCSWVQERESNVDKREYSPPNMFL